jgi:hypothetical protein
MCTLFQSEILIVRVQLGDLNVKENRIINLILKREGLREWA